MTKEIEPEIIKPAQGELSDIQKMEAQSLLVDFQTARAQIEDYQEMQHNLLWVNTSAAGAIVTVGIALKNDSTPLTHFLLAIPLLSGFLGILWVSLGMKTVTVSDYIRDKIAPRLRTLCQNHEVMGLEAYFREEAGKIKILSKIMSKTKKIKILDSIMSRILNMINIVTIPAMIAGLTFVVFCVAGLIISGISILPSCEGALKALWWFSLVLTFLLVVYGLQLGMHFRSKI